MTLKFFLPKLFIKCQDVADPAALFAATQAWDRAVKAYEQHLQRIRPQLPSSALRLLDDFALHDAEVIACGQAQDRFFILVQPEAQPTMLLQLVYDLAQGPLIERGVIPAAYCSEQAE
jgi:hypothetical protein